MGNTIIEFKNVSKVYKLYKNDKQRLFSVFCKRIKHKNKRAVDHVSFKVDKQESVALFGKNGAGKSTILKMITGVSYPTEGEVIVKGRVSALLELTSGFDPEFTGRENIYLKGQLSGLDDSEIKELEPIIVDFAEIGDYIDQPVRTYSSGMKARLGFAINVNIRPDILIVDEALSVGDADFKRKCIEKIDRIIEEEKVTLLFVTHAVNTAKQFCKRGIVMKDGKLIYDSDIDDAIKVYRKSINGAGKLPAGKGAAKKTKTKSQEKLPEKAEPQEKPLEKNPQEKTRETAAQEKPMQEKPAQEKPAQPDPGKASPSEKPAQASPQKESEPQAPSETSEKAQSPQVQEK